MSCDLEELPLPQPQPGQQALSEGDPSYDAIDQALLSGMIRESELSAVMKSINESPEDTEGSPDYDGIIGELDLTDDRDEKEVAKFGQLYELYPLSLLRAYWEKHKI